MMETYIPNKRAQPILMTKHPSAWGDIPTILPDIIERFGVPTASALEFGTEYGYSTSALANYFDEVIGVDTFEGDFMTGRKSDHYQMTCEDLAPWPNITLVKSSYQEFIKGHDKRHGLIHIDIVHTYEDTYRCCEWSLGRADLVVLHDTLSFPDVNLVCIHLADRHGLEYHNYPHSHGLGILARR